MDLHISMKSDPNEKDPELAKEQKAEIRMYDASNMQMERELLMDDHMREVDVKVPQGGRMEIKESGRAGVFDAEQKAVVPKGTAERESNIDSPNTPNVRTERELRKHEEQYAEKHNKELEEKRQKQKEDRKKYEDEGVDAKELRMKEEAERKARQEEQAKTPPAGGYAVDTSKPVDQAKSVEMKDGEVDMSKGIDTSKDQKDTASPKTTIKK